MRVLGTIFLFFLGLNFCTAQTNLTLKFTGFTQNKGRLMIAVYQQDNFKKAPSFAKKVAVSGDEVTVEFQHIPEGDYAVMAFQDLNGNYRLDKAPNGRPEEPYGLSGNPVLSGPPTWKALAFNLTEKGKTLRVNMVNTH